MLGTLALSSSVSPVGVAQQRAAQPGEGRGRGRKTEGPLGVTCRERGRAGAPWCVHCWPPACCHPLLFLEAMSCHEVWPWCQDCLPCPRTRQLCVRGVGSLLLSTGQLGAEITAAYRHPLCLQGTLQALSTPCSCSDPVPPLLSSSDPPTPSLCQAPHLPPASLTPGMTQAFPGPFPQSVVHRLPAGPLFP